MNLTLLTPTQVLVDQEVTKILAEAENGSFCLLPHHVDFLAALVPGILTYVDCQANEHFIAVDEGLLVKQADAVSVSVRQAVPGGSLGQLKATVVREFEAEDERQRACQAAIASLEASFLRRFLEFEES